MGAEVAILAGLTAITAGSTAFGQIQQGKAERAAQQFNADVARQQRELVLQSGRVAAEQKRREARKLLGRQRALVAKSGLRLVGSPLNFVIQTAAEGEFDARAEEYNASIRASSLAVEAEFREQLGFNAEQEGFVKAGNTLLTQSTNFALSNFGSASGGTFSKAGGSLGGSGTKIGTTAGSGIRL